MNKSRLFCCLLPFILTGLWVHLYDSLYGKVTVKELKAEKDKDITRRPLIKNYTMMCFKNGKISYGGVNVGPLIYLLNKINETEKGSVKKPRGMVFRAENTT